MGFVIRLSILAAVLVFSFLDGGLRGVFYGFLLFGCLAFAWYTIIDTWNRLVGAVRRPNVTIDSRSVNVFTQAEQARRGVPVASETIDDFAGMIEYRKGGGIR